MITIDSRELATRDEVADAFRAEGIPTKIEVMTFGDYRLDITTESGAHKVVVVERKTPGDFINSTHANVKDPATKLARQINGCLAIEDVDLVVLLIDGIYYPLKGGKMKAGKVKVYHNIDAFASKLRSIHAHGVRVEHNMAEWYLPRYLVGLYKYERREDHSTLAMAPKAFTIPAKEDAKWTVLMGIRGVGPHMARTLLENFGTVAAIAQATTEELANVKGVGPKMAETIQWYLT
jgi:ERCC4-type nuclease